VVSVDRGRYGCVLDEPGGTESLVTAMKARELGRGSVVVGDRVALAGETSGAPGTLARIVRVGERTSVLRRSPDDTDPLERIVVANAEQMVIVSALADPAPKTRFIDRCLVAAYDAGLEPLLVLTKSDLASPRRIRAFYRPLGLTMLTTRQPLPGQTLARLRKALDGRISVLIGQSGVGKSSLVNALIPDAGRAVGRVNAVTGKGRHTSSSAIALRLPGGRGDSGRSGGRSGPGDSGWLIDTPGVRGFGLGHVAVDRVAEAFGDLAAGTAACPPGCDHLSPGCALSEWATSHDALPRLESLRRLLRSREPADPSAAGLPARLSAGQRDGGTGTVSPVGSYDDDLRFAHVLADAADDITTKRFRALDLRIETKPDLTPVSDADRATEESLRNILRRSRPRDAVLGEESGQSGIGPRRWVLDPIDATKNYVRGVPVWATLIGLMDGDRVVVGVVTAPALGRRWWAAVGGGAWSGRSLTKASRCRVSQVSSLADASFCYSGVGGWAKAGRLDGFLGLSRAVWRTRGFGDFWSHMLVAEGAADISAEPEVSLWDLAALQVIVEEAGGRFTSLDGVATPDGGSVVCSNGRLHDEVLARLADSTQRDL
jgi:histidinol phosphatase-like enzyme (inositol monophosphatase family)/ribosome small subunit-dependent GTPase A